MANSDMEDEFSSEVWVKLDEFVQEQFNRSTGWKDDEKLLYDLCHQAVIVASRARGIDNIETAKRKTMEVVSELFTEKHQRIRRQ